MQNLEECEVKVIQILLLAVSLNLQFGLFYPDSVKLPIS